MVKTISARQKAVKQELLHKLTIALDVGIDFSKAFALTVGSIDFSATPGYTALIPENALGKALLLVAEGKKPAVTFEALGLFDEYELAVISAGFESGEHECLAALVEYYLS